MTVTGVTQRQPAPPARPHHGYRPARGTVRPAQRVTRPAPRAHHTKHITKHATIVSRGPAAATAARAGGGPRRFKRGARAGRPPRVRTDFDPVRPRRRQEERHHRDAPHIDRAVARVARGQRRGGRDAHRVARVQRRATRPAAEHGPERRRPVRRPRRRPPRAMHERRVRRHVLHRTAGRPTAATARRGPARALYLDLRGRRTRQNIPAAGTFRPAGIPRPHVRARAVVGGGGAEHAPRCVCARARVCICVRAWVRARLRVWRCFVGGCTLPPPRWRT